MNAQVDTRRMVETVKLGSMRSTGSAVANGDAPNPSPDITEIMNG